MTSRQLQLRDGRVAAACDECGSGGAHHPAHSDLNCGVCVGTTSFRRCARCYLPAAMPPAATGPKIKSWRCMGCGTDSKRAYWLPGYLGDFMTAVPEFAAIYQRGSLDLLDAVSDPDRRRVEGTIIEAAGISGHCAGGSTILFDRGVATLLVGGLPNPVYVPYGQGVSLQVRGAGHVSQQTGGRFVGGGFGLEGAAEGMAIAGALNVLTTSRTRWIETILTLTWQTGHVTIVNNVHLPEAMVARLAPVFARLQAAPQRPATPQIPAADISTRLRQLADLHAAGALSNEEFAAAKTHALTSSVS